MEFTADIENCLRVLRSGGLILYPTDTIWGIGCDATYAEAVKKIFSLKHRSEKKGFIILIADKRDLLKYSSHPDPRIMDYLATVKKPTTVIYEGAIGLAENLIGDDGTIAIRQVETPFCKHLIKRFRKPIVSTSANISGHMAPGFFDEIAKPILEGVDYVVQYGRDDRTQKQPSSVVKFRKDGTVTVIRP